MTRITSVGLTLVGLLWTASAFGQASKEQLVGKYTMDASAEETLELRADGSANMGGDEMKWSVKGNQLTIDTDTVPFKLAGNKLTLTMAGMQMSWTKVGAAGKGPSALQKAAAKANKKKEDEVTDEQAEAEAMAAAQAWLAKNGQQQPAGGQPQGPAPRGQQPQPGAQVPAGGPVGNGPQDSQIAQLLLSTGWCSFSYNQTTGTTRSSKGYFRQDGTIVMNSGAETYSSGYGGTVAGQSNSGTTMRWRIQNLRLYVDDGSGMGFQDVNASLTQNSSGSWILKADGKEYSMCR
ncbi:MAG: hypothetical protein QM765_03300 [Myxococcales bacterium]